MKSVFGARPMGYTVLLSETFQNQLLELPQKEIPRVIEKVKVLRRSPEPDAKNKKRLVNYKSRSIFRIRSGDYRIVYSFGDDWIKLVGVDHRKDVYHQGHLVDYDDPTINLNEIPRVESLLEPKDVPFVAESHNWLLHSTHAKESRPCPTPLGRSITSELLNSIRIDEEYFPELLKCQTDVDLIGARVSEDVRNRVFDVVTARNYASVDQQPVKKLSKIEDLEEYHEGSLLDFQLLLDPYQRSVISKIAKGDGPFRIKGAPGTGKSTVMLYAIADFRKQWHKLNPQEPRILFTTYTNALTNVSRELLDKLLATSPKGLEVTTATRIARRTVKEHDGNPILRDGDEEGFLKYELNQAIDSSMGSMDAPQRRELESLVSSIPLDYLIDEIEGLIVARNLSSLEEYRSESRLGRQRQLGRNQRALVWQLHEQITDRLEQQGITTWARLNRRAWQLVQGKYTMAPYDAVFVDEAQDLSPNTLRLLESLCRSRSDESKALFIAADSNQTIYGIGRALSWSDIHPALARPRNLTSFNVNYRSTLQILRAAESYLTGAELEDEQLAIVHMRKGPRPSVSVATTLDQELEQIAQFISDSTLRVQCGLDVCAVLAPSKRIGQRIAMYLTSRGMQAIFSSSEEVELSTPGIKVLTLHSAKGLEFPIVAVALRSQVNYSEEESREEQERQRRLNHMAMTRATRTLLVTISAENYYQATNNFTDTRWQIDLPSACTDQIEFGSMSQQAAL